MTFKNDLHNFGNLVLIGVSIYLSTMGQIHTYMFGSILSEKYPLTLYLVILGILFWNMIFFYWMFICVTWYVPKNPL